MECAGCCAAVLSWAFFLTLLCLSFPSHPFSVLSPWTVSSWGAGTQPVYVQCLAEPCSLLGPLETESYLYVRRRRWRFTGKRKPAAKDRNSSVQVMKANSASRLQNRGLILLAKVNGRFAPGEAGMCPAQGRQAKAAVRPDSHVQLTHRRAALG